MKYCSMACRNAAVKRTTPKSKRYLTKTVVCECCRKEFHPWLARATMRYCSVPCRNAGQHKPILDMSPEDVAWLAGLFDGEGCITIETSKNGSPSIKIGITNTCRPLLEHVKAMTGVGYITTRPRQREGWKTTYDWHTTGVNARALLFMMYHRLFSKKERAEQCITPVDP